MTYATARTVSLHGISGHVIDVQADITQGMVSMTLVGRPDAAINEARDRCRAAVVNSGFDWPATKRVTILLSPADLPKRGPHFDLPMAVAVLAASGTMKPEALEGLVLIGELTLDGRLRAVPGVLPMVMAAKARGCERVIVPEVQAAEALLVPGMKVHGARSLRQVVAYLKAEEPPSAPPVEPLTNGNLLLWRGQRVEDDVDLADVQGMADARFALEVAASGGHHLLLSGPKGSGKTTLAERVPGLLPDLPAEEALELSAVHSLAGDLQFAGGLARRPPFRAPHHSASKASVLGGGSGRVHPGEISRALHGVLFLDEFPLFNRDIIDALRQPLESGEVTIARGEEVATFPARTMFVLAANPCPCGDFHPDVTISECSCGEVRRRQYRSRLAGPVIDRIDITRHVEPVKPWEMFDPLSSPETTSTVRARVTAARRRQAKRYQGTPWRLNSDVAGPALEQKWPLTPKARQLLESRLVKGELTRRGATRVHRVAWTLADLRHVERPGEREVEVALTLRAGEPLPLAAIERGAG